MISKPNGRWVLKKKFTFAGFALIAGTIMAFRGVYISEGAADVQVVLGAFSTYCGWLLGLIFAADVADKKLNGGSYNPNS